MSDIMMTNRIVQIHLASWRYFAALTLPPLALMSNLLYSALCLPLILLFFITHYYCWRLWLDEQLFSLLSKEQDFNNFDSGMVKLWPKKFICGRPLEDRLRSIKALFIRALFSLVFLWLLSLFSVLIMIINH